MRVFACCVLTSTDVAAAPPEAASEEPEKAAVVPDVPPPPPPPAPPAATDDQTLEVHGYVRVRHHVSNFSNYAGPPAYDFQFAPPDRSVPGTDDTANYLEQRAVLLVISRFADYAAATFGFELDYRAGDSAFGVGRDAGGALQADQVNLETKSANLMFKVPSTSATVTAGLQTIKDPYNGILLGYADAVGVTAVTKVRETGSATLGYYRFWQPSGRIKRNAAVDYLRAESAVPIGRVQLGVNLHAILDRSGLDATSTDPGVLGGKPFDFGGGALSYNVSTGHETLVGDNAYKMTLLLPGVNVVCECGPIALGGFFVVERGRFDSKTTGTADVSILSYAGDLHAGTKRGRARVDADVLYVSGAEGNGSRAIGIKPAGFYTPGAYSLAAAWMGNTGMKIVFSDFDATRQDQSLIYDSTNTFEQQPLGLTALLVTGSMELSDRAAVKAGAGHVRSTARRIANNERTMATEVNAAITFRIYKPLVFELMGAYAVVGEFYRVSQAQADAYNAIAPGNDVAVNVEPANVWRVVSKLNLAF
jgi:hypothetical protein